MINDLKIKRINELYKKYKNNSITIDEEKERQQLRKEYIEATKKNIENRLNSIKIKDSKTGIIKKLKKRD